MLNVLSEVTERKESYLELSVLQGLFTFLILSVILRRSLLRLKALAGFTGVVYKCLSAAGLTQTLHSGNGKASSKLSLPPEIVQGTLLVLVANSTAFQQRFGRELLQVSIASPSKFSDYLGQDFDDEKYASYSSIIYRII